MFIPPAMGVYESTPTNVTDGDLGVVGITTGRRMKTSATIDAALPAGTNNIGDVDVASSALPTGASTSANQSTIIGHLDGVEGLLTTIDADTSNLSVVGGGTEAAAIRVTIANNSTGVLSVDDNGGSLTIDGTVDLGATDNAVLDAIAASVAAIDTDTTTIIGHVDGLETSNSAIQTSVQLIDDTVQVLGTDTYTEASSKGITLGAVRRDADTTLANTTNEFAPLQVDANGRLKVEAFSGETLPVSLASTTVTGTVAVTQSGTWDEVGINDSGNSITVDNGGTFVVQENGAALTALQLIDDTVFTDDTSTHATGTTKGIGIMAVAAPTDTALNANDIGMPGMTANRELYASITTALPAGTNNIGDVDIVSGTITTVSALGTGTTGPQKAEDVASAGGDMGVAIMAARLDTPVANAGVSNDGDYTTPILDNFRKLWISGTTPEDTAHVAGEAIMQGGVRRIDTPATSAGSSGDWATMDASAEGAIWATLTPTTTGGCSIFRSIDIDETEEEVKGTAGNVYGYYFANTTASARYLKFYNATAASVSVGTTTPVMTLYLPPTSAGHIAFPFPIGFSTAICVAATTGVADADTGAPGANDCLVMVYYK